MKKVQLEMGGKNPMVVLDDADLKVAIECAVNSAFFSTGQRCTASSRFIVTDGVHDDFVAAMAERMKSLCSGRRLQSRNPHWPGGRSASARSRSQLYSSRRDEGAKLVAGGELLSRDMPGFYLFPALFAEVDNRMRIAREEIFGPVATVIRARNYENALEIANDTPFDCRLGFALRV